AVHLLSLIAIFLIGRSVELNYDLLTVLVVAPPAILLTWIPISLAGWGVREGAMIGLFTLVGADKTLVLSMSILYGIVLIISSQPGFYVYLTGRSKI
ncbi:MAG TPA: lysylphosphatidylglycerol synthase domain-containing protein, partial [Gammaproteobacteria bacterium]